MRSVGLVLVGLILGGALVYANIRGVVVPLPALSDWNWIPVLLLFLISGAFGGILAALQMTQVEVLFRSSEATGWNWIRARNVGTAVGISAVGGAGAAVAALFVMLLDGKIKARTEGTAKCNVIICDIDALTYISTGVLAGFLGFRLLTSVATNFLDRQKLGHVEKETDRKLEEMSKKLDLKEAVTKGMIACTREPNHPDIAEAITKLSKLLEVFPAQREAIVVLGRLYRRTGDLTKAIAVLQQGLDAMKRVTTSDADRSGVNYNLACYHCLLSKTATGAERDRLLTQAFDYLRESIRLDPSNAKDAATDEDFGLIWGAPEFAQILTAAGATPPRPPVATNDNYTTPQNTPLNVPAPGLLSNDSSPRGQPLRAIQVTGPAHGTLALQSDGAFIYTPNNNYVGPDNFTYKTSDGILSSNTATVLLSVTPAPPPAPQQLPQAEPQGPAPTGPQRRRRTQGAGP
jgi:tetratricopeptide (TPR) repeat protein